MSRITLYWKLGVQSIFIQPEYSNAQREKERESERGTGFRRLTQRESETETFIFNANK